MKAVIKSVEGGNGRKVYTIEITAGSLTPQMVFEERARMKALVGEGLIENIQEGFETIKRSDFDRLTHVTSNRKTGEAKMNRIIRTIKVTVKDRTSEHEYNNY